MTTVTIENPPNRDSCRLPEGEQLTVVMSSDGTALVDRFYQGQLVEHSSVAAGVTQVFGEYSSDMSFKVTLLTGSMTMTTGRPTSGLQASRASILTLTGTSHDIDSSEAGSYLRMTATGAKTITFRPNSVESLSDGSEFHIRNAAASGDITLTEGSGVTLNAPASGTLVLNPGMTVTVKRVAVNEFDVLGQTVAA